MLHSSIELDVRKYPKFSCANEQIQNRDVDFFTSVPIVANSTSIHRTFMDTTGRTALTIHAVNLVDELRGRDLIVTYKYPFAAALKKPLTVFTGALAIFVVSWFVGNLDVSIKASS